MIECVTVGDMIPTHSYFYIDDASKHGFLIDAGAEGDRLAAHAAERGWTIERLLLTHCHFDHIGGVDDFRARIPCPVCAAAESPRYCSDPNWNLSTWGGAPVTLTDSCIFYSAHDGIAFVGDTIFFASVGRTDFPGGDTAALWESIRTQIFTLPPDTVLYSGHTEPTTVGDELARYRR